MTINGVRARSPHIVSTSTSCGACTERIVRQLLSLFEP
jgi:hypothetical protein